MPVVLHPVNVAVSRNPAVPCSVVLAGAPFLQQLESPLLAGSDSCFTLDDYPTGEGDEYGVVSINEKFMESQRVWIVRETDKVYAIFGKCTHLGCTPKWFSEDRQFKCPCHGSKYYSNGVNFAGPAPRPMDRYGISVLEDGRIKVDKGILYTVKNFDNPECFLKA